MLLDRLVKLFRNMLFATHAIELLQKYKYKIGNLEDGTPYIFREYICVYSGLKKQYYGGTYLIIILSNPTYPNDPPYVYILPFPKYVTLDKIFEKNHAKSCLRKERVGTKYFGFWHIDNSSWKKIIRRTKNPLVYISESIAQILQLY